MDREGYWVTSSVYQMHGYQILWKGHTTPSTQENGGYKQFKEVAQNSKFKIHLSGADTFSCTLYKVS